MDDEIKRWTARRRSALMLEIIQGKTTVVEASRIHVSLVRCPSPHSILPANKETPDCAVRFATLIKQMLEENPSFGYRTVAHLLRFNKNTV